MYTSITWRYLANLFVAVAVIFALFITTTHAVTESDLQQQKRVVIYQHISLIQEQFKLIQLTYIKYLEERISALQTLVGT